MNELAISSNTDQLTMSSREIAELVEVRHDNVRRTILRLSDRGTITLPPLEEKPSEGGRPSFEYAVCKRDSYVIVAQLSPEFTARLVDRWQELEAQAANEAFEIPQSYSDALRLAADKTEEAEALAQENRVQREWIDRVKPAVDFARTVARSEDAISVGEAAKILGTGRQRLFTVLRKRQWITRYNEPYQKTILAGLMDVKLGRFRHPEQGLKQSVTPLITGKGLAKLQRIWLDDVSAGTKEQPS